MIALVTGGASCGKSAYAEQLCMRLGARSDAQLSALLVYLAAMRPFGEEGAQRVEKHRAQRAGKGFQTIECYEDFGVVAYDGRIEDATVLLECLGNVVANELFAEDQNDGWGTRLKYYVEGDTPQERIEWCVAALMERAANVVIVGNEVGGDGVAYPKETRAYQQVLGDVSRWVAQQCDLVVECVAGVPNVLKGADVLKGVST